jgi:Flp pilus assembly pilin Flp
MKLNNRGQGLTEYITLLVLVSLVGVGVTKTLGKKIRTKISLAAKHVNEDISFKSIRSEHESGGGDDGGE